MITPHIKVEAHTDGVYLSLKHVELVLPADMAREVGLMLISYADRHDPLGVAPLPVVTPKGDPI